MKDASRSMALMYISRLDFWFYESIQYSEFKLQVDIHLIFFHFFF